MQSDGRGERQNCLCVSSNLPGLNSSVRRCTLFYCDSSLLSSCWVVLVVRSVCKGDVRASVRISTLRYHGSLSFGSTDISCTPLMIVKSFRLARRFVLFVCEELGNACIVSWDVKLLNLPRISLDPFIPICFACDYKGSSAALTLIRLYVGASYSIWNLAVLFLVVYCKILAFLKACLNYCSTGTV